MKRILQENPSGCGLACVAMLANASYKDVRDKARSTLKFNNDHDLYTNASDIRALLAEYEFSASKRLVPFRGWDKLPDLCILAINYNESKGTWHWVVYAHNNGTQFILDPKPSTKTDKRVDFKRISAKWYLEIKRDN